MLYKIYNMENENFIGYTFPQNCGDDLKVIEKIKTEKRVLFKCQFLKYPYEVFAEKGNIKRGSVLNPQIEIEEFVNKIHLQNCGDSLKIIGKNVSCKRESVRENFLWICEFQKYPCRVLASKQHILKGAVNNPKFDEIFINTLHLQKCKDYLKIVEKTNKKSKDGSYLFKCQFKIYPGDFIYCNYSYILSGKVNNPQIEKVEFINKIWPQNCGDSLRIIKKSNKKDYWICEFINYPYKIESKKCHIIEGNVQNIKAPQIYLSKGEKELFEYIQSLLKDKVKNSDWKALKGEKEIDIYIPSLKLGFEYNGSFWHSDNKKYGVKNDYHLKKSLLAKKYGIKLIHIWEDEWNLNKDRLKIWIKNKIFNFKDNLYFEKYNDKFIKIDLSKEPEYLDNIKFLPIKIKRNYSFVYNCGYAIKEIF